MSEAVTELYNFILENGGAGSVTTGAIENWFTLIRQAVRSSTGEPTTPENSFNTLTEGMAARFYREGITTPKLLEAIRESMSKYLDESPEALQPLEMSDIFQPIRANSLVRPNTLLANMLSEVVNKGEVQIVTGRKKSKNPLTETVIVAMNPREVEGVKIDGNYDLFREAVFCAILSIYLAGNRTFTAYTIRRFLAQDYKTKNIHPPTITEITNAIEDLRVMHVKVDISDEIERRGMLPDGPSYYGAYMLVLDDIELKIGGENVKGYLITRTPLLYEHALRLGQLQTFPAKLLAITDPTTGKRARTTTARTKIQMYLLTQISNIRSDLTRAKKEWRTYESKRKKDPVGLPERQLSSFRKMNGKILFQTIFEKTDLAEKQNKTLIEYKSYINLCLQNWTEAGVIKGFTVLHDGKRKDAETGINILLD